eukprot:scaffold39793_cov93-Cyclotella_meneghiniana.AAC.2
MLALGHGQVVAAGFRGKVNLPVVGEIRPISSAMVGDTMVLTHKCRASVSWFTFAVRTPNACPPGVT